MVLDVAGVFETPRKVHWKCAPSALQDRELGSPSKNSRATFSPAFTPDLIQSLERSFSFKHSGCVNTASFNEEGTLLVTGSDDLKLKIWRSSNFVAPQSVKLKHEIVTGHQSNIFHALFSPESNSVVVSCAADGQIRWHDLANPGAERMLASFSGMANMFVFEDENTILATNFRRHFTNLGGSVEGVDVRTNADSYVLLDSSSAQVKALAVCPWSQYTMAVGVGDEVWFCDTRMRGENGESLRDNQSPPCLLERLTLTGVNSIEAQCRRAMGTFLPYHGREPDFQGSQLSKTYAALTRKKVLRHEDISISSIEFSKLSKEFLVSFQGDAVYRFKCSPLGSFGEGCLQCTPVQFFAGHVNEMTFLKRASYFGPQEEYVCCGGDDGNVFVYSSETGDLVSCKKGDGFGSRRGMGEGIVNGVVPHPSANSLVSYGLDNDAKLWTVPQPKHNESKDEDEEEDERQEKRRRMVDYANSAIKRTEVLLVQPGISPVSMMSTLVRCTRMRENCVRSLGELSETLPSSSLIMAAFDDDQNSEILKEFMLDPYSPTRFEYCIKKTEDVRERGNVAFHEGRFREALELYSIAVQYCLGAFFLRAEMLEVFDAGNDKIKSRELENLTNITAKSAFEVDFPSSNFAKRKIQAPDVEFLKRIVEGFKQVWNLFLITNLNAAQAGLKLKTYKLALSFSEQAMEIDPGSSKGGFRKASALKGLGRLNDALREFKRVRNLPDGDTPLVRNCIRELLERTDKTGTSKGQTTTSPKTGSETTEDDT